MVITDKKRGTALQFLLIDDLIVKVLEQTINTQEDEYAIAEEQAHCTYDETYLDHILLPNETSTISNVLMKKTNKATAMLSPTTARIVTRSCVAESEINLP